jgi:HNH/ENDO VII superfamily nuclease
VTFGGWGQFGKGMDAVAHGARNVTGRAVRFTTKNQRWGQNFGDGVYVLLSVGGIKKLSAPAQLTQKVSKTNKLAQINKITANPVNTNTLEKLNPSKLSRVNPINGQMPKNYAYAHEVFPLEKLPLNLRGKYPHSVPFTGTGHPDFSRYAIKKVEIKMTGVRKIDEGLADKAAGFLSRPEKYTWHHHHDAKSMYLVPEDIHKAVRHTGGVAVIKKKINH